MSTPRDDLNVLRGQLEEGSIQRAYQAILGYMSRLRTRFATAHHGAVTSLYQGPLTMTYFAVLPPALKLRGLKFAIVFDFEQFCFKVWLAGRNRSVQRHYWRLFEDHGWSASRLVAPAIGIDAIVESDVASGLALGDPDKLTLQIEAEVARLLGELEQFLEIHDPRQAD